MSAPDDGGPVYTLRDYFAAAALSGLSVRSTDEGLPETWNWYEIAKVSYKAADAMLAARKERT